MRLPYVIVTLAMLASVSTAQAIPNMWTSGFGMGVTEYIITSPDKVVFNLNCTGNCHERCNSDPHPTPEIRSRG